MNDPASREEAIFDAAIRLNSPAKRAALLDRECAGDPALRAAVEELLQSDTEVAADFLRVPVETVPGATIAPPPAEVASMKLGTRVAATPVTLPPEQYQVGGEIARGGMGNILEAEDRKLGRKVAMKVMKLEASASEFARTRFVREATVLARLEHPNIVPIHELGRDAEDRLFYTMKLVQGRTLQAVLKGLEAGDKKITGHYTLDRLLTIFRKVCDALSLAHSRGVIHRDLKPENVMVGEFGEVLVMDWGIAKILGDGKQDAEEAKRSAEHRSAAEVAASGPSDARRSTEDIALPEGFQELSDASFKTDPASLTLDGTIMGTPHYMSPEQADGRVTEIDQQSDVFSLGAILYAILTLRPPVEADSSYDVLELIKRGEIRPPTTFNVPTGDRAKSLEGAAVNPKKYQLLPHCPRGKIPAALSAVAMKALKVEKSSRYLTVAALAADIEAYQGGFATTAEQAGAWRQIVLLTMRHKAVAASLAVLLLVSVGFVLKVMASERKATRNAEVATTNEKAARRALARSALSLAEAAQREGNGLAMQAALNDVPEDLRDATWTYLLGQSDTSLAALRRDGGAVPLPTMDGIAADPSQPGVFAVAGADYRIVLVNVRSGQRVLEFMPGFKTETTKAADLRISLAFSPDGQSLAVGRYGSKQGGIVFHSTRDGKKLSEWDAPTTASLQFSPDGKLLLQNTGSHANPWWHTEMWDTATGQVLWKYNPETAPRRSVFTSDGEQVLTSGKRGELRVLKASDGTVVRTFPDRVHWQQGANVFQRVLGASGLIAQAITDSTIIVSDMKTGSLVTRFQLPKGMWGIRSLVFTPDGEQLVTTIAMPDGREALNVWNARTGFLARSLLGGRSRNLAMAVHPVSGELLVCGDYPRAWDLTGVKPKWLFPSQATGELTFWGDDDTVIVPGGIEALARGGGGSSPRRMGIVGLYQNPSVSADGHWAAIPSGRGANTVRILHQRDGVTEEKQSLKGPSGQWDGSQARLSPEGDQVVVFWTTQHETPLHWYSRLTGKVAGKIERQKITQVHDLGWPSGSRLIGLATTDGLRSDKDSAEHVVLWDMTTGRILRMAPHPTEMDALALAPDGKRFAEAGADKSVRIRDAETLEVLKEFRAHDGPITALAWHPSQPVIATASADLSLRLWSLDTGQIIEEFRGWMQPIHDLAFSPSGRRLAAAIANEPTRVWEPESLK